MIDRSVFYLGLMGIISVIAVALSRVIHKPAPVRNFTFSFFLCAISLGFIFELAQDNSVQVAGFNLGFVPLLIFVVLIGVFTEIVLVTMYRGNFTAGIFSGGVTGLTAFFVARLLPQSYIAEENIYDWSSLIRIGTTLAIGFLSYAFIANREDQNESD